MVGHTRVREHLAARQRGCDSQGSDIGDRSHVWTFHERVGAKLRMALRAAEFLLITNLPREHSCNAGLLV